jgi:hypothetical protein
VTRRALWLVAAGLTLTGCWGGSADDHRGGPDPAAVVPPGAAFYADAEVKPEGDAAADAGAALRELLSDSQRRRLDAELEGSFSGDTSYRRDVKPWIDRRVGIFFTDLSADADGALLLATTDPQRAERVIGPDDTGPEPNERRTYRGVDYVFSNEDGVAGIVGRFAVLGSEPAFKRAVDASLGRSLADSPRFQEGLRTLPEGRLATAYADTPRLLGEAISRGLIAKPDAAGLVPQLGAAAREPLLASLGTTPEALSLEVSAMPITPASRFSTVGTGLISSLPVDAWGVIGAGNLGSKLKSVLEQVDGAGRAAARLQRRLDRGAGLDLDRDLLSWLDDVAIFVEGTTRSSLEGAAVLHSSDPGASAKAIDRVFGPIAPAPPVHVVQRGDRVVAAYGARAVQQGFEQQKRLAGTELFDCASTALGRAVTVFLAVRPMLDAAEAFGAAADPDYRAAAPYLRNLEYLVTGWRRSGERDVLRIVAGLRCPSS